jgi:hypothetical protein
MARNAIGSYNLAAAITPSNTVNIVQPPGRYTLTTDAVYVGVGGDIVFVLENDVAVTFLGAITGTIIPIACKRVNSTNTNATDLVALWNE